MGRFSPTVQPSGVSPLAEALKAGGGSYFEEKERRRKARLERERMDRLNALTSLRERQSDISAARSGYRGPDAQFEVGGGELEGGGPTSQPTPPSTAQGRAGFEPESNELAAALEEARGQTARRPFTPGDVREGMVPELPETFMVGADRAPGRIPLPSGGSLSEVPPEEARAQERQSELAGTLAGGFSDLQSGRRPDPRTRAEAYVGTGEDVFRPPEAVEEEGEAPIPTWHQLQKAGARQDEIEAVWGDPEAMRDLRDELVGRRTSGRGSVEDTEGYSQAVRTFADDPEADPRDVAQETGLGFNDVLDARKDAFQGREHTPTFERSGNVERVYGPPVGQNEEVARDAIARQGGERAAHEWLDRIIEDPSSTSDQVQRAEALKESLTRYTRRQTNSAAEAIALLGRLMGAEGAVVDGEEQ